MLCHKYHHLAIYIVVFWLNFTLPYSLNTQRGWHTSEFWGFILWHYFPWSVLKFSNLICAVPLWFPRYPVPKTKFKASGFNENSTQTTQLSIPTHAQLQCHRLKFIKNHLKKKTSSVYDCTVADVEYICNSNSTLCLFYFAIFVVLLLS